jgi:dienelactone hydrolase
MWRATLLIVVALYLPNSAGGQTAGEIVLRDWLVIEPVGTSGRVPIHTDAIEADIVAGTWSAPRAGDAVTPPDGQARRWEKATPDEDGWLNHAALRGGYAFATVERDEPGILLLEASGHSMVYVNGEPRVGDPYAYGWAQLPFKAVKGTNTLLFRCGRGRVRARLLETEPGRRVAFNPRDVTVPDLLGGYPENAWGSILVTCMTESPPAMLLIDATCGGQTTTHAVRQLGAPLSTWKVPFRIGGSGQIEAEEVKLALRLRLPAPAPDSPTVLDETELTLAVRRWHLPHKQTFISGIDGSVQYYAALAQNPAARNPNRSALFLTLHGAAVEAIGQVSAYGMKGWGAFVAPTNRRPYGFDWENWGRLDAMEVLALASEKSGIDPQKIFLLGHSMGGHGVWHIGATFPDRFAAIAPSAGWISFESYSGGARVDGDSAMEQMLRRAGSPSDTLALSRNYLHHGVYILHGDQDDNVPVEQARQMRAHLGTYHPDFAYHEQPGRRGGNGVCGLATAVRFSAPSARSRSRVRA